MLVTNVGDEICCHQHSRYYQNSVTNIHKLSPTLRCQQHQSSHVQKFFFGSNKPFSITQSNATNEYEKILTQRKARSRLACFNYSKITKLAKTGTFGNLPVVNPSSEIMKYFRRIDSIPSKTLRSWFGCSSCKKVRGSTFNADQGSTDHYRSVPAQDRKTCEI